MVGLRYWITVLANRTTLADNTTLNDTRIATIAQMFMDKPEDCYRRYTDLTYMLKTTFNIHHKNERYKTYET